jgi:hypothetical protein
MFFSPHSLVTCGLGISHGQPEINLTLTYPSQDCPEEDIVSCAGMKRKIFAIGLLALLCLFAAGWFLGYVPMHKQIVQAQPAAKQTAAVQATPYVPTPPTINGIDAALLKARWGLEVTPAEPNAQPLFTKGQILNKAYEFDLLLRQATSVELQLGYLRNPYMLEAARRGEKVFPQMADSGLAWILIFEGYQSVSSGPAPIPGGPPTVHGRSNEINYVFSAITGEYIQAFIYR